MSRKTAFWDSSSLVPICVKEKSTPVAAELLREWKPVVWWVTPVEVASAIYRRRRDGSLTKAGSVAALEVLKALQSEWDVLMPSEAILSGARTVLAEYDLRAADALQLAAALEWRGGKVPGVPFVSGDRKLLLAAEAEGFAAKSTAD